MSENDGSRDDQPIFNDQSYAEEVNLIAAPERRRHVESSLDLTADDRDSTANEPMWEMKVGESLEKRSVQLKPDLLSKPKRNGCIGPSISKYDGFM
jgi:hypothetical protein